MGVPSIRVSENIKKKLNELKEEIKTNSISELLQVLINVFEKEKNKDNKKTTEKDD